MQETHFGLNNKGKDINFTLDGKPSPTKIKDSTPTGLFIDPKKVCSDPNARSC